MDYTEQIVKRPRFKYNDETQRYWLNQINAAKKKLDLEKRASKWKADEKYATYNYETKDIPCNRIRRRLHAQEINVFSNYPSATPHFIEEDDEERWQEVSTALGERELRKPQLRQQLRAVLRDAQWKGIGFAKSDFVTKFGERTPGAAQAEQERSEDEIERASLENQFLLIERGPVLSKSDMHGIHQQSHEDFRDTLLQLIQNGYANPAMLEVLDAHIDEHSKENMRIEKQGVTFTRVPPGLVYYDADALQWDDVEWYAVEYVDRLEALKLHSDLKNTSSLKGSADVRDDPFHENRMNTDVDDGVTRESFVRYYFVHSIVDNKLIIVADEGSNQLPLYVGDWPYPSRIIYPLVLEPVNDRIHGVSQVDKLREYQQQSECVRSKVWEYMKVVPALKLAIDAADKTDKTRAQLRNPNSILVETSNSALLKQIDFGTIRPEFMGYDSTLAQEMNEESCVPEFAMAGGSNETATISGLRSSQFDGRIRDMQRKLADLVEWFLKTMTDYYRELGDTDMILRIVGDRGKAYATFNPRLLPRSIEWDVDADSFSPETREIVKKRQLELLQVVGPFLGNMLDAKQMISKLLRVFGVENPERLFLQAQPTPPLADGSGAPGTQQPGTGVAAQPGQTQVTGNEMTDSQMASGGMVAA